MDDWFSADGNGAAVDVLGLLDSKGGELLHEVCASGALVSIGLTRDGGALGVTITVDGRWRREYFRDSESLAAFLEGGLAGIRAAVAAARAPAGGLAAKRKVRAF